MTDSCSRDERERGGIDRETAISELNVECTNLSCNFWCFISGVYAAAAQDPFALGAAAAATASSGMQVIIALLSILVLLITAVLTLRL